MSICLLGGFLLREDDREKIVVHRRRHQALLAYVLMFGHPAVGRGRIAYAFWPDSTDEQAHTNLRNLIHSLRVENPGVDQWLVVDNHAIGWNTAVPRKLDVAEFERAAAAADIDGLKRAVQLYSGDFLPDLHDDWVVTERERLRRLFADTLQRLADLQERSGQYPDAIATAERLLALDTLDESHAVRLMRLHAHHNDRPAIHRTYLRLVKHLEKELGIVPDADTTAGYHHWLRYRSPIPTPFAPQAGNLTRPLTSFIGRQVELAELARAMGRLSTTSRLMTLTGEGGSGKTRLAMQVAGDVQHSFPHGVWLVELEQLADPDLVPAAVASALGLVQDQNQSLFDTLVNFLAGRHILLILDNCEHLIDVTAALADKLLRRCPTLTILTTSREPLDVPGEFVWQVPSLALPPAGVTDPAELERYDAVQLFVGRANAALPGFSLTAGNAPAVAQVCRRLDGIPLAIELAAACVRLLRVEQIVARLDDRFALLAGGSRTAAPRQQTLRALIDWSHHLLAPPEQMLFRRLAVFQGSFTLAAAEAVGDPEAGGGLLVALEGLVSKSLVNASRSVGQDARYSLHETIRQYAGEKLRDAGETAGLHARHAAYYTALVEAALPRTDYDDRWLARVSWLEEEYGNWQAVLNRALVDGDVAAEWGVRVAARLACFWLMHVRLIEGRHWLEAALAAASAAPVDARADLFLWMATLMIREYDPQGAKLAAEGVALFRDRDDPLGMAWGLTVLGLSDLASPESEGLLISGLALAGVAGNDFVRSGAHYALARLTLRRGDFETAAAHGHSALDLVRQTDNRMREPLVLRILGVIASWQGDSAAATALYEEALALTETLQVQGWVRATILNSLGEDARRQRQYQAALAYYHQGSEIARQIGDLFLVMGENLNIGWVMVRDGDVVAGERLLLQDLRERLNYRRIDPDVVWNLWGLAVAASRRGDLARAAQLYGGAAMMRESTGFPVAPVDWAAFQADEASVQMALGEPAYADAFARGMAMDRAALFAFALGG